MGSGGGGSTKREWGGGEQVKIYPYNKGKSGGRTTSFEVFFTWEPDILAKIKGGHKKFPLFRRGRAQKVLACLEGGRGGCKKFRTGDFTFCSNPRPTCN